MAIDPQTTPCGNVIRPMNVSDLTSGRCYSFGRLSNRNSDGLLDKCSDGDVYLKLPTPRMLASLHLYLSSGTADRTDLARRPAGLEVVAACFSLFLTVRHRYKMGVYRLHMCSEMPRCFWPLS
jgi:hypothetical protein